MMKECLSWNKSNKLIITANGNRFLSIMEKFHKNIKKENLNEIEHCYVMQIDRSTFEKAKSNIKDIPDGQNIYLCFYY